MFKVICTLANASDLISGVEFQPGPEGAMESVSPVDEAVAARFAKIPGYNVVDLEAAPAGDGRPPRISADEAKAIRKELTDLGIAFPNGARPNTLADLLAKAKAEKVAAQAADPKSPEPVVEGAGDEQAATDAEGEEAAGAAAATAQAAADAAVAEGETQT